MTINPAFIGATVVIKYGGNAMIDENLKRAFALSVIRLHDAGITPVIVHGGGPQINTMLNRLGVDSEFKGGLRVTSPEVMDVVGMVLVGQVQRDLVGLLNENGPVAVGMSGEDAQLLTAERREVLLDGVSTNIGQVGDVVQVRTAYLDTVLGAGFIPVVSTVARGADNVTYNVNADTAAAAIAVALQAQLFVVLTDVEGLFRDWPASNEVVGVINATELSELLPTLDSGMAPKMEACLRAVTGGVSSAHVIDGRAIPDSLLAVFTDAAPGTTVLP